MKSEIEDKSYLTLENREDRKMVELALEQYLKGKEEGKYFSSATKFFVEILYDYLELINVKYKRESPYGFYHIVALSKFESKDILIQIFQNYNTIEKKILFFQSVFEGVNDDFIDYVLNISGKIFPELTSLKKYNLSCAEREIHDLIIHEIEDLLVKDISKKEFLKMSITRIINSRKANKGERERYRNIVNNLNF